MRYNGRYYGMGCYYDANIDEFAVFNDNYGCGEVSVEMMSNGNSIDIVDGLRRDAGFTDLVCCGDNDVCYDFYLIIGGDGGVSLIAICKYGKADDGVAYELPLNDADRVYLLCKVTNELLDGWRNE